MKDSGLTTTGMSPCLRLFIESVLDGMAVEIPTDEIFAGDELAMPSAFASSPSLESDRNYN